MEMNVDTLVCRIIPFIDKTEGTSFSFKGCPESFYILPEGKVFNDIRIFNSGYYIGSEFQGFSRNYKLYLTVVLISLFKEELMSGP